MVDRAIEVLLRASNISSLSCSVSTNNTSEKRTFHQDANFMKLISSTKWISRTATLYQVKLLSLDYNLRKKLTCHLHQRRQGTYRKNRGKSPFFIEIFSNDR